MSVDPKHSEHAMIVLVTAVIVAGTVGLATVSRGCDAHTEIRKQIDIKGKPSRIEACARACGAAGMHELTAGDACVCKCGGGR